MKSSNSGSEPDDTLLIGEIVSVHGLRGAVKIRSYADSPTVFAEGLSLRLQYADGRTRPHTIDWAKPHGKGVLLSIDGVTDRDAAEALIGSRLYLAKTELPDLEDGTYYWFELIGLAVYGPSDQYLGTLEAILETGSNDVYVVRDNEEEILVPALDTVVKKIDIDRRRMDVVLPEGL